MRLKHFDFFAQDLLELALDLTISVNTATKDWEQFPISYSGQNGSDIQIIVSSEKIYF